GWAARPERANTRGLRGRVGKRQAPEPSQFATSSRSEAKRGHCGEGECVTLFRDTHRHSLQKSRPPPGSVPWEYHTLRSQLAINKERKLAMLAGTRCAYARYCNGVVAPREPARL